MRRTLSVATKMAVMMSLVLVAVPLGGHSARGAQQRPYRQTDRQVGLIIANVEQRSIAFRGSLDAALDRGRLDGTDREDDINRSVSDFTDATDALRERFDNRRAVAADVENVLNRASAIDNFVRRQRLTPRAQSDWSALRASLDNLATAYNVSWGWQNNAGNTAPPSGRPYRLTDAQIEAIINRVDDRARTYRSSVDAVLDQSRLDGTRTEDELNNYFRDFVAASDALRERFNDRRSVAADVENVLDRAVQIDQFMSRTRLANRAERDWSLVKTSLDELARAYSVAPRWNGNYTSNNNYPSNPNYGDDTSVGRNNLAGTYRLDVARSDDPRAVAERAAASLPANARQRATDNLLRRLDSPESIALDQRGRTVTIASSRAPQTSFEADGRERAEQMPNGRTMRVRATLTGNELTVSSVGDRATDFTVTFVPMDGGRRLMITRRVTSDRFDEQIVIRSYYDRTSDVAQFNIYDSSAPVDGGINNTTGGAFGVPNNTSLVAVLENNLTTQATQEGDRFTARVSSPSEYDGAIIEGYVSQAQRGGRVSGRSQMTLNFERIRMRDGRSYRFAGFVEKVRTPTGENVSVDNEGAVREGDSQSTRTVQRTAIGTAIGAAIGAIAGGGKGAAIGAVIGAAGGAGSVYAQGRDDLELLSGSELTIRSSAPQR